MKKLFSSCFSFFEQIVSNPHQQQQLASLKKETQYLALRYNVSIRRPT
jgi:hypothetical protein